MAGWNRFPHTNFSSLERCNNKICFDLQQKAGRCFDKVLFQHSGGKEPEKLHIGHSDITCMANLHLDSGRGSVIIAHQTKVNESVLNVISTFYYSSYYYLRHFHCKIYKEHCVFICYKGRGPHKTLSRFLCLPGFLVETKSEKLFPRTDFWFMTTLAYRRRKLDTTKHKLFWQNSCMHWVSFNKDCSKIALCVKLFIENLLQNPI